MSVAMSVVRGEEEKKVEPLHTLQKNLKEVQDSASFKPHSTSY